MSKEKTELYKYFRLNDNFIKNLKNKGVYSSTREELNDPFDILSYVKIDGRKTGYQTMINIVKKKYPQAFKGIPETNINLHKILNEKGIELEEVLKECDKDNEYIDPNDYFKYIAKKMRVISFTDCEKSMLMWAHYADSYKGVMVKYIVSPCEEFEKLIAIKYEKRKHDVSGLESIKEYIFGYKLKDWCYEKEYRVVIDRIGENNKNEPLYFYNLKPVEIYLGARYNKNDKEVINNFKGIIKEYSDLTIYKSILKEENFEIEYKKIEKDEI